MKITITTSAIKIEYENKEIDYTKQLEFIKECIQKVSEETVKIKQA